MVVVAAWALAGCAEPRDAVFGPVDAVAAVADAVPPMLMLKAGHAPGPPELTVAFSIEARHVAGAAAWSLDFGDGTPPLHGTALPTHVRHTYAAPGTYVVVLRLQDEHGQTTSSLPVVVAAPPAKAAASSAGHAVGHASSGKAHRATPAVHLRVLSENATGEDAGHAKHKHPKEDKASAGAWTRHRGKHGRHKG